MKKLKLAISAFLGMAVGAKVAWEYFNIFADKIDKQLTCNDKLNSPDLDELNIPSLGGGKVNTEKRKKKSIKKIKSKKKKSTYTKYKKKSRQNLW